MAVFRVEKTKDYTVMSNHHLRNKKLSLKAKGLMSLMLSLPENWDYTTKGLASICRDGVDSISSAIKELEENGYIIRRRLRNKNGQLTNIEYTIFEQPSFIPKRENPEQVKPKQQKPKRENPEQVKPKQENPEQVKPEQENPLQLNTKESNTKELNTNPSIYQSINQEKSNKALTHEYYKYQEILKKNIEYDYFIQNRYINREVNEILNIMLEMICKDQETIFIGNVKYPKAIVKERVLEISKNHIEYILECMEKNYTKVHNIKSYLQSVIFNAPITINNYYRSEVNYDLNGN